MSRTKPARRRGLPSRAEVSAPSDRRFKRADVRPGRRRQIGLMALRVARYGVPALVGLAAFVWAAGRVLDADALHVRHVVVQGNVRLAAADLEALVTTLRGQSIFRVDLEASRQQVLASPWVADVRMSRVLPATVRVEVVEREPMAVARLGRQLYLVDPAGVIIDEYGPEYAAFDLPIVDGLMTRPMRDAPVVDPARARLTGSFLASLDGHPELRERISQVDVSDPHDVAALLTDDPAWLHLGDEDFPDRLAGYLELAPSLRERMPDLDYVDLRFGDNVFVREHGRRTAVSRQ
ncbi:MAG: FtsQ-type POTRA domain-containing protein [Vicinamibacterales bacterium]